VTPSERRTRQWAISEARDALIRAAASLTEPVPNLTFALLEATIALHRIGQADIDNQAHDEVIAFLRKEQDRRQDVLENGSKNNEDGSDVKAPQPPCLCGGSSLYFAPCPRCG